MVNNKTLLGLLWLIIVVSCNSSVNQKSKSVIVTHFSNNKAFNPIEVDTLRYSLSNDNAQNYIYKLYNDKDTVYKLSIKIDFDSLYYIRGRGFNSSLINGGTYWVAGKYFNVYLYIVEGLHYPLYIAFTPKFGVLCTKSFLGDELFEYPDEDYYLTAKALSLNTLADYRFWHPNDTIIQDFKKP